MSWGFVVVVLWGVASGVVLCVGGVVGVVVWGGFELCCGAVSLVLCCAALVLGDCATCFANVVCMAICLVFRCLLDGGSV